MAEFRKIIGREFFASPDARENEIETLTDDLLFLQSCVNFQRVWTWPSPLVDPKQYERKSRDAKWREANQVEYARRLERLRKIATASERMRGTSNATVSEMAKIAEFIVKRWGDKTP